MATIRVTFYQLRQGDTFEENGVEYMKVWRSKTVLGVPYNAIATASGDKRFFLDDQYLTPTDEYFNQRISPIAANVHEAL